MPACAPAKQRIELGAAHRDGTAVRHGAARRVDGCDQVICRTACAGRTHTRIRTVPTGRFLQCMRIGCHLVVSATLRHAVLEGTWNYVEAIDVEANDARRI